MSNADIPIVAYTERDSIDPQTGEEGITRTEWRVVPAEYCGEVYGWGLERRTIRRGVILTALPALLSGADLGWEKMDVKDTRFEALQMIDNLGRVNPPVVVAVDPECADAQAVMRHWAIEDKYEEERQRERVWEAGEKRRQRAESEDAFHRLHQSATGKLWADRWNDFTSEASAETVAKLRADRHAVELHDAVIAAVTVPAKRRAIKVALAYYAEVLGESSIEELSERKG